MFFDLHVPVSEITSTKGKGKQQQSTVYPIAQIEAKIELLVHLGYTVIALCQTVHKRVEKNHVNILDDILPALKKRPGVLYLKRLNIILDEDSEKGFGLINASVPLFNRYDLLSLTPTTQNTFSQACLSHSQPSPLTAHIISLPLTLPRMPYMFKHTHVRTAIRNGAVFELDYVGAMGGDHAPLLEESGAAQAGTSAKRNWWANARELCRVTKGKGLLVSSGSVSDSHFRPPRDVANVISMLGIPQNLAHDTLAATPKSLVLRAQTRMTYRAVLSEPEIVFPPGTQPSPTKAPIDTVPTIPSTSAPAQAIKQQENIGTSPAQPNLSNKKRFREGGEDDPSDITESQSNEKNKRKRRKKNKGAGNPSS